MQEAMVSTRPAMHWIAVTDTQGRTRLQAAWAVPAGKPEHTSTPHAA